MATFAVPGNSRNVKLCFEQTIPLPRRTVFGFFQNPACLAVLHEGWSRFRLLKHETQICVGCETWVEVTIAGFVPVVLGFRHTLFEPPLRFAEELIHGPFSKFHHVHEFEEQGAGCLGAADIAIFHSVAHGIRTHPDSAMELVTHSLRGPTYAALFVLIPNFAMHGLYAWLLIGIFVFDLAISVWDFSLEQGSRRFLGGLPSGEYVLHIAIAMLFGALVALVVSGMGEWVGMPSRLAYEPARVPI
jgi:ligand-binding SRPBCC domain-containing protein